MPTLLIGKVNIRSRDDTGTLRGEAIVAKAAIGGGTAEIQDTVAFCPSGFPAVSVMPAVEALSVSM